MENTILPSIRNRTGKNQSNGDEKSIIALAGNPNVGKSTVFNGLTGLKQHTGNWPGKTVANATGEYTYKNNTYTLVDLPGIYSILSSSAEEEIARDFICSSEAKAVITVADATCLERNLNLVLQILEITGNCGLCVNLMDEAKKKKIVVDTEKLSSILGIPVIGISAKRKKDINSVKKLADDVISTPSKKIYVVRYNDDIEKSIDALVPLMEEKSVDTNVSARFIALKLLCGEFDIVKNVVEDKEIMEATEKEREKLTTAGISEDNINDYIVSSIVKAAEEIAARCVSYENEEYASKDRKIDRILTSKTLGIPIMLCMLGIILYISIIGANYPSEILSGLFDSLEKRLLLYMYNLGASEWVTNLLILGMYRTLAWVVSVMLPPMAIFFPLFTLLEDSGYLPRVAFNLDGIFKKCCAHGKQCLTMCMGLGCNAAGVTGARIIDSPRERLIAILTNSLVPCNGRFPTLITISAIFIGAGVSGVFKSVVSAVAVLAVIVLGILATFGASYILSKTVLKGKPSQFTLELPPYRNPKIGEVIYRSVFDRTLFVLGRAAAVAAPAGAIIWFTANIFIGETSVLNHMAAALNPLGRALGLDGYILIAFILGIPANEIVMPILLMCYTASGHLSELGTLEETRSLLLANDWNIITAINMLIFTVFHFPCATTLLTVKKETGSLKWTFVSFALPTVIGLVLCFITAQFYNIFA